MATGPKDTGRDQADKALPDAAKRQAPAPKPMLWTDRADMVSVNSDANKMFRRNSEQLQKAAQAKREDRAGDPPASQARPHHSGNAPNYAALKQEHAAATPRPSGDQRAPDKEHGGRQLTFVKDHERGARQELKTESAKQTDKGLTFVKDQSQGIDRGR